MATTTTTTTAQPAPVFDHQQPEEPWPAYGRRAVSYLLAHGLAGSWQLSDAGIEAAADGARVAATSCAREQVQLAETLAQLERDARRLLVVRKRDRDARLAAWAGLETGEAAGLAPEPAAAAPESPQTGTGKGGGAKVPRTPRGPQGRPGGGYAAMDETGAGAFRVPVVPAAAAAAQLRAVPALAAAADDLF